MTPATLNIPRVVVAGTQSGVGKTTVTLGLLDGLRRRGLSVQPFKVGPDFIDPGLHALAAGRTSRNLDPFLMKGPILREVFQSAVLLPKADAAVIEGMMGLFDGVSGGDELGSAAHVSKLLRSPVLLVADVSASARSLGALVEGFIRYDRNVDVAGLFLNNVGGEEHLRGLKKAVAACSRRVPVLGWLFRDGALVRQERHLGLVPAAERGLPREWLAALRRQMDRQTGWKELLAVCRSAPPLARVPATVFTEPAPARARIAVARDPAFCFYYQDNLDLLARSGAELVPFSPLEDGRLPKGTQGIYLGGGYPEVHAKALSRNRSMREQLLAASRAGMPIYGECGGLMYLGDSLTGLDGRRHRMVGALPLETRMEKSLKLAYVRARVRAPGWLLPEGTAFPGHIFHFSALTRRRPMAPVLRLNGAARGGTDGYRARRTMAGYVHTHFASVPELPAQFAREAGRYPEKGR